VVDMDLVDNRWRQSLTDMASKAESEVLIISPFVTGVALDIFFPLLEKGVDCKLITRLKPIDFLQGASSIETIAGLIEAGVKVKTRFGLHAKVYLFDCKIGVITSANLTGGGFQNIEWGMSFAYDECPDPFHNGKAMWQQLKELVTISELKEIQSEIRQHEPSEGKPKIPVEFGDRGEIINNNQQEKEIPLITNRDQSAIQDKIEELKNSHKRFSRGNDYKNLMSELGETKYRKISIRSYLWLLGWCNTGGSYSNSEGIARSLATEMFGYFPPQFLQVYGNKCDLKEYRYGRNIPFKDDIIAAHLDRINKRL